jgi:hypothetical protein
MSEESSLPREASISSSSSEETVMPIPHPHTRVGEWPDLPGLREGIVPPEMRPPKRTRVDEVPADEYGNEIVRPSWEQSLEETREWAHNKVRNKLAHEKLLKKLSERESKRRGVERYYAERPTRTRADMERRQERGFYQIPTYRANRLIDARRAVQDLVTEVYGAIPALKHRRWWRDLEGHRTHTDELPWEQRLSQPTLRLLDDIGDRTESTRRAIDTDDIRTLREMVHNIREFDRVYPGRIVSTTLQRAEDATAMDEISHHPSSGNVSLSSSSDDE